MDTGALLSSFGLVFVAELGDKTQFAAMALAARYPWRRVFLGIALAFALLNLAAVTVGQVLFAYVPIDWIRLGAAALFGAFGVASLRAGGLEEGAGAGAADAHGRPATAAFLMILMAELGDKTQLATAGLAAQQGAPLEVFCGSSLALWSVSLVAIFLGRQLTRWVSLRRLQQAGGVLFLLFAAAALYQALS